MNFCTNIPDKLRLHKELILMRKQSEYNSNCKIYYLTKEQLKNIK